MTSKRERFCKEYITDRNAVQAAVRAGYAPGNAVRQAAKLMNDPEIRRHINEKLLLADAEMMRDDNARIPQSVIMYEKNCRELVGGGYSEFWNCKKRYRAVKGSRASKKSKTSALNLIVRMVNYPLSNALCVRRYRNTLRDSMFSDLKWAVHRLQMNDQWEFSVSPMQIVYKPTGQKILFRGLDDGMKITSISVDHGVLNFVWIEEAYEITNEDDFNKLDMSIRGDLPEGYFKQITLTFNPWSANSWLKRRFFDKPSKEVFTLTTTWKCNEWLGDDDRQMFLEMEKNNPRRYRIEGEGEWGISEGLIYENVEIREFDVNELRKSLKGAYGLDFGYTDPNAFICMLIDEKQKVIYIFDEFYKKGMTNLMIAQEIKRKGYGSERIICDCAEPKSIDELCDEGIKAYPSGKGRDSVNHGIQLIQNYMIVVLPRCREFIKEIRNYSWERNKEGRLTDKPEHEFSHGMDAMRYGVTRAVQPDTFSFD